MVSIKKAVQKGLGFDPDDPKRVAKKSAKSAPADPFASTPAPSTEYVVTKTRPSLAAVARTVVVVVVVGVVVLAGVGAIIDRFTQAIDHNVKVVDNTLEPIRLSIVTATAETAATAYLSHDGRGGTSDAWSGTAFLATTDTTTQSIVRTDDPNRFLVVVNARVVIATRDNGTSPAPAPGSTLGGRVAPTVTIPAGYTLLGTRWWTVTVPVTTPDSGAYTTGAIVFGAATAPSAPIPDGRSNPDTTASTAAWARTFFDAVATGDTTYLTTPGSTITGLDGAVQVNEKPTWAVTSGGGRYSGAARVTWKAGPADLTVQQSYSVGMETRDGRWYATTLTPTSTEGPA